MDKKGRMRVRKRSSPKLSRVVMKGRVRVRKSSSPKLSHVDKKGKARMVDVGAKPETRRVAIAEGRVRLSAEAFLRVRRNRIEKGDVLTIAKVAGIQAAKETSRLVPLCHPIPIDAIRVDLSLRPARREVFIEAEVATRAATGVEMEAMTAVAVAALTVYDMCKAVDRGITIEGMRLVAKSGGRSGEWRRAKPVPLRPARPAPARRVRRA